MRKVTEEELEEWRTHGYVLVKDMFTPEEVAAAQQNVAMYAPTGDEFSQRPKRYSWIRDPEEFKLIEGPFVGDALNSLMTAPVMVDMAERALGGDRPFLTQAILWPKYAQTVDYEQDLHLDYHDNTLTVPSADSAYEQLAAIVYLTDVTEDLGPTHVVSRQQSKGVPLWPWSRSRALDPELYADERPIVARAGSVLLFGNQTWHRGSAMRTEAGHRFTLHLSFRRIGQEWMAWRGVPRYLDHPEVQRFFTYATPQQRELFGFPPVGDAFWTDETISATSQRYEGIDMGPYRQALAIKDRAR